MTVLNNSIRNFSDPDIAEYCAIRYADQATIVLAIQIKYGNCYNFRWQDCSYTSFKKDQTTPVTA